MMPDKASILIVDDHPVVRDGLECLFEREADLEVCGKAGGVQEALHAVEARRPDIVLVDLSLDEEADGLVLVGMIKVQYPPLPALVLTMHSAADYLQRALEAGARGLVSKRESIPTLAAAIRRVLEGHIYIGMEMMDQVAMLLAGEEAGRSSMDALSRREREVMRLLGHGYRPRQVAETLHLSPKTIHAHRENIKRKLNLGSASELDQLAIRWMHSRDTS